MGGRIGEFNKCIRSRRWLPEDEGPSLTWARLDENFPDHPKVVGLSDRAYRVFVNTICYANKHLTDGVVSVTVQQHHHCTKAVATELVRAGLWEIHELGAFVIHDYWEYQPTRKEVLDHRQSLAEAGRLGGLTKARNRRAAMHVVASSESGEGDGDAS